MPEGSPVTQLAPNQTHYSCMLQARPRFSCSFMIFTSSCSCASVGYSHCDPGDRMFKDKTKNKTSKSLLSSNTTCVIVLWCRERVSRPNSRNARKRKRIGLCGGFPHDAHFNRTRACQLASDVASASKQTTVTPCV